MSCTFVDKLFDPCNAKNFNLFSGLWIRIGSGFSDFVDPDPYSVTLWIRIHIGNPDPGARK
jgi:hypothetical protein